jgi:hypothetical protein
MDLVVLLHSSYGAAAQPGGCVRDPAATAARVHPSGAAASSLGGQYNCTVLAVLASYCPPIGGQCWQRTMYY